MKNKNKQKGYALLFSILIISAISVITAGLINTIYKQLILSLLSKDSSTAFYQADNAMDCAMHADLYVLPKTNFLNSGEFSCGGFDMKVVPGDSNSYDLLPQDEQSTDPCFRIHVSKSESNTVPGEYITNQISARGYNICDMSNQRTVEREILIEFK